MKKVLFTATVDSHILHFHIPFLKFFKENGYEVHVATNGDEEIPYCDKKIKICFERSPLKLNNLKAIKQLKKVIMEEEYDIIHTHTPMGAVVTRLAAKKARKKFGTRVIYTAHGFHFFKGASIKNWLLFYPVEKYLSKYTDTLITINQEDYELAKNKFKKCKDIEYVPGVGIDENKFNINMTNEEKINLRNSLNLKENDFVMIYVARMDKNKNQGFLINVMKVLEKKHDNIHLLLVGPDENYGIYQKQASNVKNVHFLGFRKDIARLMKISDIAVSSSLREGLPVNIMEAMISGLPIVATDTRGVRDLIKSDVNGFVVEKNNINQFVESIEKLYSDKKLQVAFSNNNVILCKNYYLSICLNLYKKIYFKKSKVLHVLSTDRYSGAENVVCTIISNMSKEYEMVYCSVDGPIRDFLKDKGIRFYGIKKLNRKNLKKVIDEFNPDIIHAHDIKAGVISAFTDKKRRIVSHVHVNHDSMKNLNLKTFLYNLFSKRFHKIVWVSKSAFDNYHFYKKICNKSIVLYNVIDSNKVVEKSHEFVSDKKFDLIYVGRLTYQKNPQRLVSVIDKVKKFIPNVKLGIIGTGDLSEEVSNLIKDLDLSDNVEMLGFQKNPFPYMINSKMLIMTSRYEGTPMCALEAIACGVPIISTRTDGLVDIIEDGKTGFLSDEDDVLVKDIVELIQNEDKLKEFKNNVLNANEKLNNLNSFCKKIKDLYL